MAHDTDRGDEERPSDADSGVRLSKNTPRGREDAETIADPNTPDRGESGRLPNWEDREKDERPGWEKAKMPKQEWLRAKSSYETSLASATPGSPEFSRLMELRVRLHLGPAPEVDFGEISAYKRLKYQEALADDLRREIADKEAPEKSSALTAPRIMVAVGILVLVVAILFLIILQGPSSTGAAQPTANPTPTTPVTAVTPIATELTPPQATQQPTAATLTPGTSETGTPATAATAPIAIRTARPTATTKAVVPPPATGEVPFFKPKQK